MKTDQVRINKTPEQPDGVEIELVQPESDVEGRLLAYLLGAFMREATRQERVPYELPEQFEIQHRSEGTFVLTSQAGANSGGYYQQAKPLAIMGIRVVGNTFDVIHASADQLQAPKPQPPDAGKDAPA